MNQLALITGASSGMGLEYAKQLAKRNFDLLIVSNQQDQLVEAASSIVEEFGVNVIPHYQDLASPDAAERLHDYCLENKLEVEVLVNNAGMFFFKELTPQEKRAEIMLSLHISTPTRLCILFGEDMKKRGHGYILNMSSMAATLPMPGITIYSATKAYLKSFSRSLYFEMRPYGVGVTVVCPAAIATPLYRLKPNLMKFGVGIGVIGTPQWLVSRALRAMFHKRRTVRPGLMNHWLPPVLALMPNSLINAIWKKVR